MMHRMSLSLSLLMHRLCLSMPCQRLALRLLAINAYQAHITSIPTISLPSHPSRIQMHSPAMRLEVPPKLDILIFQLSPPLGNQSPNHQRTHHADRRANEEDCLLALDDCGKARRDEREDLRADRGADFANGRRGAEEVAPDRRGEALARDEEVVVTGPDGEEALEQAEEDHEGWETARPFLSERDHRA